MLSVFGLLGRSVTYLLTKRSLYYCIFLYVLVNIILVFSFFKSIPIISTTLDCLIALIMSVWIATLVLNEYNEKIVSPYSALVSAWTSLSQAWRFVASFLFLELLLDFLLSDLSCYFREDHNATTILVLFIFFIVIVLGFASFTCIPLIADNITAPEILLRDALYTIKKYFLYVCMLFLMTVILWGIIFTALYVVYFIIILLAERFFPYFICALIKTFFYEFFFVMTNALLVIVETLFYIQRD